mmetsp:Transcript_38157/g.80821  ORF Transcript_38157/g.80821 Transcript_38157/m.80821 type:complete len:119 (+) Transcript_38157:111-467(+)
MPPGGSTGEADGEEEASRCSSFPIDAAASGPDAWGPGSCGCGVGGGPCDDMPGVGSAAAAAAAAATGGGGGELSGDVPISAAVCAVAGAAVGWSGGGGGGGAPAEYVGGASTAMPATP